MIDVAFAMGMGGAFGDQGAGFSLYIPAILLILLVYVVTRMVFGNRGKGRGKKGNVAVICKSCGTTYKGDEKFCPKCGKMLTRS
jgi:hypothetical protein